MVEADRSRDRVARICASVTDARHLRVEVLDVLRRTLGFDAHVWVLTDPVTTVGGDPCADVPDTVALPTLIKQRYALRALRSGPEGVAVRLGDGIQAGVTPFHELLGHAGVSDLLSVRQSDGHGSWAFLDLWRSQGSFSERDGMVLTSLTGELTRALRRRQAAALETRAGHREQQPDGTAVVVLDDELGIVGDTSLAQEWLARLLPNPDGPPVPAAVYNVAAQLLAVESGLDSHEPVTRVHLGEGRWLRVAAARLAPQDSSIVAGLEPLLGTSRLDLFSRAHGLTPRESELVDLLASGVSTHEAARRMHLSAYTVQDHLKGIFARTGTATRGALVARALGLAPESSENGV